jgi:hypothetical protein
MGNTNAQCMQLPAQSGKTRKMEELITKYKQLEEVFDETEEEKACVNIIISDNNKILVQQTNARIEKDLGEDVVGGVFSWISGTRKSEEFGDMKSSSDIAVSIWTDKTGTLVVCSHKKRIEKVFDVLKILDRMKFSGKINIWIDEADKRIRMFSQYDGRKPSHILPERIISHITLVSATFDSVMKMYSSLRILPYNQTYPECYRGLIHSNLIEVEPNEFILDYVSNVIDTHKDILVYPGARSFIPAGPTKNSHDAVAELLLGKYGFSVIIINGDRKELLIPDGCVIDLNEQISSKNVGVPVEFNSLLANLYQKYHLYRFPLAITGHYCVSRGVTFQSSSFMFDYGIIPHISNGSDAYQIMARLFGNVGDFHGYKPVDIYTTPQMFLKVEKQENIAMNIARIVAEEGLTEVGPREFKMAGLGNDVRDLDSTYEILQEEFEGEDGIEYANMFMSSITGNNRSKKIKETDKEGDFIKSSTSGKKKVLSYDEVKMEIESWTRITSGFDVKDKLEKNVHTRMIICYRNITDPTSVVFICRILCRKDYLYLNNI